MISRSRLDELLPEAKLGILRCLCGGAESLPVHALAALGRASREWSQLSAAPEILPFGAVLRCRLLTPSGPCKRAGHVWPPGEPLEPHRTRDSQPLGDRDALSHFLHTCFRRGFVPAQELHEAHLQHEIHLDAWMRHLTGFRQEHFGGETGQPRPDGPEGDSPAPVWCAAACTLPNGRICVAGGGCYNFELADAQTNMVEVFWHQPAVHVFDVQARRWTRQPVTGDLPPCGHTFAAAHTRLGSRLVIWCGGYYGRAYNTAYALDTDKWEWHALRSSSAEAPSERYFVASFELHGGLFAWGGRSSQNGYCADLWRLDPSRAHQDVVHVEEVGASGDLPPGKFAATLTNCDDRFALLFGGGQWKNGGLFKPDMETFTLDLESFAWTRLQLQGPRPAPRCQHSAVNLGGSMVLVLGGYDGNLRRYLGLDDVCVLNVRGLRWMTLRRSSSVALRRGMRVQLVGLRAAAELNGLTGTLVRFNRQRNRWHVRLDSDGEEKLFKAANLQACESGGAEEPGAGAPRQPTEVGASDSEGELQRHDHYAPPMLSPVCEDASAKLQWIGGQFPSARAGIAVADASDASASRRLPARRFYLFGGAQYVHQDWYADLYECSLSR